MRQLQQLLIIITGCIICPFVGSTQADTSSSKISIFQKMVTDSIYHIQLEADFDHIFTHKKLKEEHKAYLTMIGADSTSEKMVVKIRPRGVYRRGFCDVPPLRLNFDDDLLDSLGLNSDFDKLKLVTHCINSPQANQVLFREYLAYRLYNQITPQSFKVHLVKITYINVRDKSTQEEVAFIIENNAEMAARQGGNLVKGYGYTPTQMNTIAYQNCMLFNFMIGNLDWNLRHQRNVKFVQCPNSEKIITVPYDFDMSAFVFPSYACLNTDFKQRRFTDRYCVGHFSSKTALEKTAQQFQAIETDFYHMINNYPMLTSKSKKKMTSFLKNFFKVLDNDKKCKSYFLQGKN